MNFGNRSTSGSVLRVKSKSSVVETMGLPSGLLISIIANDSDTIGDTFEVSKSVSPILLRGSIVIGIGDTFFGCIGIDYRRYF